MDSRPGIETVNLQNIAHFDHWAATYDSGRMSRWFRYTQSLAISALSIRKDSKVLDVGCGTGSAVLTLASLLPEGKACGLDLSKNMTDQAWLKVPEHLAQRIEFREGSSESIPYPDEYFDQVLCTNSFHHYPFPIKALKEMQRVAKPGGQIVILENAPDLSWYTWLWDRLLRVIEPGHVRYYPSYELGELLRHSGMNNVRLQYLRKERFKHGKIFASLQIWSGQRPPPQTWN